MEAGPRVPEPAEGPPGASPDAPGLETLLLQRDLAVALSTTNDVEQALQHVVETMLRVDGIDGGGVYLLDPRTDAINLVAHAGLSPEFVASVSSFSPDSPNAALIRSGRAVYTDYEQLMTALPADPARELEGLRAVAVVPVLHRGRPLAALNLASRSADAISREARALIETLAAEIGDAIARVHAEQALRERGEELQSLFDSLADFVFVVDEQGSIIQVNGEVHQRLGYEPGELVGKHLQSVHPEECREEVQTVVLGMLRGDDDFFVVPLLAKDGSRIPVETHVRHGMWHGKPVLIGISRDISERMRAEETSREQTALIGSLLDSIPDIVFLKDDHGHYVAFNPPFLRFWGKKREDLIGKTDADLFEPDKASFFMAQDAAMLVDGQPRHNELWMTYADGRTALMDTLKIPYLGTDGRPVGVLGVARDITPHRVREDEVRAMNAHLERRVEERTRQLSVANRELEEFVYSVSHDLRAPLRAVDGFSLAVLEDYGEALEEQGRSDLRRVRAAAHRMGDLIDALLSLTTVVHARIVLEETDLSRIAERVVSGLRRAHPDRTVEVVIQEGMTAETDGRLSEVILENLLGNAWKFTSEAEDARIEFGMVEQEGRLVFSVRDNGAGFDGVYADKLFRPFQRLHNAADFPGTGIGLATVGRVLDRLGGEYWAEGSTGEGATVSFTLG